jgi:sulfotransferase family protein
METAAHHILRPTKDRSKAPVFVLGCGRSGTTLLYHMILSAGNFAVYRAESNILNQLEPRFGDLSVRRNREKAVDAWIDSKLFRRSGLDVGEIREKILSDCDSGGSFLRIFMEEICRKQGVERWADCTPEHLLHIPRIKQAIPDALIIHIIRDGRDVALSTGKLGYIRRAWWDKSPIEMVCGIYWEWMIQRGREYGRQLGADYTEVRFDDVVTNPRPTLARLGEFIGQELDYDRIQKVGIGSVSDPNTSFRGNSQDGNFNPVGRWKSGYTAENLAMLEGLIGGTLIDLGFELETKDRRRLERPDLHMMRGAYRAWFDFKFSMKTDTPFGKYLVTDELSNTQFDREGLPS